MNSIKKQKTKAVNITPKHVIVGSVVWIAVWLFIIASFDLVGLLSCYFSVAGCTEGRGVANLIIRIPLIIGCFALAYGIGKKAEDKTASVIITVVVGALMAYLVSVPVLVFFYLLIRYVDNFLL